jgi:hypothetical protein
MRFVRVLLVAAAAIVVGALNGSVAHAQLAFGGGGGGGGGKGGGGGFSFGGTGKSGGFHGRSFSTGKGRFVGKGGFRRAHRGGHRFKYAKRSKYPLYAYGWPAFGAVVQTTVLRDEPGEERAITPPPPPRVAEWKIYQVGTTGGCQSERVNVQQGTVRVIRC